MLLLAGALPHLAAAALPALAAPAAPVRGVRGLRAPDRTGRAVESAGEPRRRPRDLRQPRSGPSHLREPPEAHRRDRPLSVSRSCSTRASRSARSMRGSRAGRSTTTRRSITSMNVALGVLLLASVFVDDGTAGGWRSAAWFSPAGVLVHVRLLHADSARKFAGARPRELDLGGRHDGVGVGDGGSAPGRCDREVAASPLGGGWPGRGLRGVRFVV